MMINRYIFSQKDFDSGSLTVLASVVHKFSESGEYHGNVFRDKDVVGKFSIIVNKDTCVKDVERQNKQSAITDRTKNQVNIDLKCLDLPAHQHLESLECNCFQLNAGGFAVFYVSTGIGGYSVEIKKVGSKCGPEQVFNSKNLSTNDLFTVTVLRPGTYSISNILTHAKAELSVSYPEIGKIPKNPQAVQVQSEEKCFNPSKIKIKPTQGLVFSFKNPSRIKIELTKPKEKANLTKIKSKNENQQRQKSLKKIKRRIKIHPR